MTRSFSYLSKIFPAHNNGVISRLFWTILRSPVPKQPGDIANRCLAGNRIIRLKLPRKRLGSSLPGMKCPLWNFCKESSKSYPFGWNGQDFKLAWQKFRSEHFMPGNELPSRFRGRFKRRIRLPARQRFATSLGCLETGLLKMVQNRRDMTPLLWAGNIFDKYEKLLVINLF